MAQERDERQAVRAIAVASLKRELELAIKLLQEVGSSREISTVETDLIGFARGAFRHAVEALDRMPLLTPEDMRTVQRLMEEFRSTLAKVDS